MRDINRILENIVYMELLRRGYRVIKRLILFAINMVKNFMYRWPICWQMKALSEESSVCMIP